MLVRGGGDLGCGRSRGFGGGWGRDFPKSASVGVVRESESALAVSADVSCMIAESPGVFSDTVDALGVLNGFSGSGVATTMVSFSRSSIATPSSDVGTM